MNRISILLSMSEIFLQTGYFSSSCSKKGNFCEDSVQQLFYARRCEPESTRNVYALHT